MSPIRIIPPGGNIPPANRVRGGKRSLLAIGNLPETAKRLAQLQSQVGEAKAWGGETIPKITHGVSFGGLERDRRSGKADQTPVKVWRSFPAKTIPRQEPLPEPYSTTSWESDKDFVVLIEGVETPNWQDHSHGISVSVHGDILRIVDTRKGASQGAVTEILIPKEYGHDLNQVASGGKVYKNLKGIELRFPKKEGAK